MTLPAGTTIDKYTLVRCIGQGGMGAVYEARHTLVGKRCAVKLLLPELAGEQEVVQRMLREAQVAAAIGHPNIVDTFDFGAAPDGSCYLVMEYLEGQSLGDLIGARGALTVELTVAIVSQVLSALEAAHEAGVVHRDLKPDNIFIARSPRGGEEVKLLDFGISKLGAAQSDDMKLTRTGAVLGTPYYMSPEQAEGARDVDHRTDLWAVGVVLYEALTGEVPFLGQTYNQVMVQLVMKDPAPPRALRPDLPQVIEAVIIRALQKDPAKRWATSAELREALVSGFPRLAGRDGAVVSSLATSETAWAGATDVPGPAQAGATPAMDLTQGLRVVGRQSALRPPRPGGRRRLVVGAGAVAALAVVSLILFFALSGDRGRKRSSPPAPPAPPAPLVAGKPLSDARAEAASMVSPLPMHMAARPRQAALRIELKGLPEGATVKLDEQPTRPPLSLPADDTRHELEVTAPGYHPLTKSFGGPCRAPVAHPAPPSPGRPPPGRAADGKHHGAPHAGPHAG